MKPLTLTLRQAPATWLDMSPLTPDRLAGIRGPALRRIRLRAGRDSVRLPDIFDIEGSRADQMQIRRSTPLLVRIGEGMTHGSIDVRGHAGQYVGMRMRGGSITVQGDAGDCAAAGMAGGALRISGNAGDFLGGPLPGDTHGMTEGRITVLGNAGRRAGDMMRRGTILVLGNAGDFAGSNLIAGTLIILGRAGRHAGYGMRRGTIILGKKPAHVLPTFRSCGNLKMEFLRLLFKQTASLDRRFAFFRNFGPEVHRYAGDAAADGQGELLILLNAPLEPRQ
jgi:formylmethanofuran dehydrogenase subunit C